MQQWVQPERFQEDDGKGKWDLKVMSLLHASMCLLFCLHHLSIELTTLAMKSTLGPWCGTFRAGLWAGSFRFSPIYWCEEGLFIRSSCDLCDKRWNVIWCMCLLRVHWHSSVTIKQWIPEFIFVHYIPPKCGLGDVCLSISQTPFPKSLTCALTHKLQGLSWAICYLETLTYSEMGYCFFAFHYYKRYLWVWVQGNSLFNINIYNYHSRSYTENWFFFLI